MTATRPPHGTDRTARSAGASAPAHGGAAIVAVRRLFTAQSADWMLVLGTTIFLVLLGLVMVLSSSFVQSGKGGGDFFGIFLRQGLFALIGIPVMLLVSRLPAIFWRRWARNAVLLGLGLQLLVFVPGIGLEYGNNRNWISIAGFNAQPSEFLKLALVVWLATVLAGRADHFTDWRSVVIPALPVSGFAIAMVLLGQDLGTVTIMAAIVLAALFFAGAPMRHILGLVALGAGGAVLFALSGASRSDRISAWLNGCTPEQLEDVCWQPMHGMWALGSGGVFGVGLGNSALKWSWLPHAESDYIFAIVGEELGLVGTMLVLLLFAVLAVGMVRLMRAHTDPFRRIATGAVLVWIVGQAFVNVAVVLGMLPVLGVPLPLISYGGSALVATLVAIGVVLSLARDVHPGPRP
ncbi:putative lipid II flippase FtsW [Yonghaparkia sp. Soil809]|uniref:putative lipid II flippase FtsW n=1 Tax=Yonghaparkia sp. Soil809 TaxID=1736417 RepID=UPI0006F28BF3|nr:putative lipid II flippase FtsW [Yonghaparkia sp. Soil809]KRF31425.1 cell division protein FtsW [Yonghaparkia sp. Soil809]